MEEWRREVGAMLWNAEKIGKRGEKALVLISVSCGGNRISWLARIYLSSSLLSEKTSEEGEVKDKGARTRWLWAALIPGVKSLIVSFPS